MATYLGTPVVAPRLKSSDHHAERDGYFARLPSLRDSELINA